jgi:hypothetical protein
MSDTPGWTSPDPGQQPQSTPAQPPAGAPGQQPYGAAPAPPPPPPEQTPGVIPLRPLGLGEILDGAISTIRAHWRVVLGMSAVVAVLMQLAAVPIAWWVLQESLAMQVITPETRPEEMTGLMVAAFGGGTAFFLLYLLANAFLAGLVTVVIGKAVLGRPAPLKLVWSEIKPLILRLFGLSLVVPLAIVAVFVVIVLIAVVAQPLGVILGIVAVVLVIRYAVLFSLATPALVLEKGKVFGSLRRSRDLVRGSWWRVLGISLLAGLIAGVINAIIGLPFEYVGGGGSFTEIQGSLITYVIVSAIGTIIATTITAPFAAGVTSFLYIDQRMRREGLDIELARAAAA